MMLKGSSETVAAHSIRTEMRGVMRSEGWTSFSGILRVCGAVLSACAVLGILTVGAAAQKAPKYGVTVTADKFAALAANNAIMTTSSLNDSSTFGTHNHVIMIVCIG